MCGIAGWVDGRNRRPPDQGLVKAMSDAIQHRGPDGEGFHFAAGVGLAHRRLAIIDLNTGQQPMFTEEGRVAIVFNGEIYNYRELRSQLEGAGHSFRTHSDTEVILRAWVEWGPTCVSHLQGMFAIALWDERVETLFLARDRLGEKPLYYTYLNDGALLFGSELKALLVCDQLERRIDPTAVQDFFSLGYIADPKTIYRDVRKLPAGHTLTIERGRPPKISEYWDAVPQEFGGGKVDAIADELCHRLASSVKAQLVADVPIGAFLSGGVDSSAISALAASQVTERLNTFTIGFDDPRFDEKEYADMVAVRYGTRQFCETANRNNFETVDALTKIFDEPFGDSSALPTLMLSKLASRTVKVALSGDGGDELFGGYRRYYFHNREEKVRRLLPASLRSALFGSLGRIYPQFDYLPRPFRARQTFRELGGSSAEGYFHNVSVVDEKTRQSLFTPALKAAIAGYRSTDVIGSLMKKAQSDDPVTVAQYVDIKTWLVGDILTKVDRTAMACGLEVRVPMLDGDFVRWSLGLPREMKLSGARGKIILKRAFEHLLPSEVLYRRKQGFSIPLASWFRGPLGSAFSQSLGRGSGLEEFFDPDVVQSLLRTHREGWADNSRTLWLLWMFQGFLEHTHHQR